ncbi:peptidylglycine alpha-hydroxylating monooxygenase [Strongylocentrotus purpuratus]|uniref:peptidylglycine monooxygenase n=1 Tax=Strongylocentrotus purpuratus TaxID=7668 RepID=A0A7M7RE30_STRPU|nr:peptidylglycine alpha-hydroxylating monooxygenase [Strongylocentrotus purpuratus]
MASFRHIFLVLALSLLTLCQVLGANTREEWIAALSRLPWLEDRYETDLQNTLEEEEELENGGEGDEDEGDGASVYFSYEPSFMVPMDGPSYQSSSVDEDKPENGTSDLRMPNVHPEKANDYFCYAAQMPRNRGAYIVGFSPVTTPGTAHHILLYGCKDPGMEQQKPWDCGEMDMIRDEKKMTAPPCASGSKILYAWAMDAPPLELPKGIGFEVGGDTGIDYLVLQVHYANVDKFEDGSTDDSGIALEWTLTPQPLKAGVYFMGSDGEIPGKSKDVHLETACEYEGPTLHAFAYRVHTHKLGQVVSGYRIRDEFWTEIGKRSPQLPQMFNPITKDIEFQSGDTLAARCTFASDRDETTYIGMTGDDEMCNFYIMYYTSEEQLPTMKSCYGDGQYKWANDLPNIPDKEASSLTSDAPSNSM